MTWNGAKIQNPGSFTMMIVGLLLGLSLFQVSPSVAKSAGWNEGSDLDLGGHIKLRRSTTWPDTDSYRTMVGDEPRLNSAAELRLKAELFLGDFGTLDVHYENVYEDSDTREKEARLARVAPRMAACSERSVDDEHRFWDLTEILEEDERSLWYHRLDRFSYTLSRNWGKVKIGRQAITWGNGFMFNTMDLLNPFAPTAIEKEYKTGDDMALLQVYRGSADIQFLYVPRRNTSTGEVEAEESSLAAKVHLGMGSHEFDFLAADHYEDSVLGIGYIGYLGKAVWRTDGTVTYLDAENTDRESYWSLTTNVDYSWTSWDKNWYGFLEFYYNSLPEGDYTEVITDPAVSERLQRGELSTLANAYLGGRIRVELHPLLNLHLSLINNLEDASGIVQPRAKWNLMQNGDVAVGGTAHYGGEETEYGGYPLTGTPYENAPFDSVFLWLGYYF